MRPRLVSLLVAVTLGAGCAVAGAAEAATCDGRAATIVGTPVLDVIHGTAGDDVIVGLGGNDVIDGGGGNDVLCGDEDPPFGGGAPGNDSLSGDAGDDVLIGGPLSALAPGTEVLNGGPGSDTVSYATSPDAVTVDLAASVLAGGDAEGDGVGADVENVTGSSVTDTLNGNSAANVIRGLGGLDVINGRAGDDTIDAGPGNDEEVSGGDGNDRVSGGDGNDILSADNGDDVLSGGPGDDLLQGGAGSDTADYSAADGGVNVNLATAEVSGADGADAPSSIENATGSSFADSLAGDARANVLSGGDGNDTVIGRAGDDTVNGGPGDDALQEETAANGADVLSGGPGRDQVDYAQRASAVSVTLNGIADDGEAGERDNVLPDVDAALLKPVAAPSASRPASLSRVTASASHISPNDDGRQDAFKVRGTLGQGAAWTFAVTSGDRTVFSHSGRGTEVQASWDALRANGRPVADGRYSWRLAVAEAAGESIVGRGTVVVDLRRPAVRGLSVRGRAVSLRVSEPVRVTMLVAGARVVGGLSRAGRTTIRWNGRGAKGRQAAAGSHPARLEVRDLAGNVVLRRVRLVVRR